MNSKYSIHERIYDFVVRVLLLIQKTPTTSANLIIINQLTRSATSIGANDREADGTISKNDFIHKYSIVRKEAKETEYWLKLLADTNPKLELLIEELLIENDEIIKIVSAIIYNTQKSKKD